MSFLLSEQYCRRVVRRDDIIRICRAITRSRRRLRRRGVRRRAVLAFQAAEASSAPELASVYSMAARVLSG